MVCGKSVEAARSLPARSVMALRAKRKEKNEKMVKNGSSAKG
jgi:hypothetical protein